MNKKNDRKREKGSGMGLRDILVVIGVAALLWVFWPALLGALSGGGGLTVTAVPGPAVVSTPTLAPGAPGAFVVGNGGGGAPTAVAPRADAAVVLSPAPRSSLAVAPRADVAAQAAASVLRIEAAGRVYEITGERLIDCANAQQNGQRTGPSCPPNSVSYLSMLGQGR